jgi:polysaccharide biosynthesis/export protein
MKTTQVLWLALFVMLAGCSSVGPSQTQMAATPAPSQGCEGRTVLGVVVGCGTVDQVPPSIAAGAQLATAQSTSAQYVIGAGDVLDIFVWHNADLSRQMPVRPDGRIAMPLLGDTVAIGKTPGQLSSEIQDKLRAYLRDPLVTVIPIRFVGTFARQIRVIGEAGRPQAIPYRSSMTVLDVMIQVGGLTRYADGDRAVLVRSVNGEQTTQRIRLSALVRDGDIDQNVDMQPGDILIIPQRFF